MAELESIRNAEKISNILGIEGSFSRRYFGHYFSMFPKAIQKGKRSRNPPLDPVNALLSFFYMMIYNLITIRLISFGFEPAIGFLHQPFRSHNALASDIMELFRADINEFVFQLFDSLLLDSSDFTNKNGVYLRYDGRKKIWADLTIFITKIQPKVDYEIANIRSMI